MIHLVILVIFILFPIISLAETVRVIDQKGNPVENAVVYLSGQFDTQEFTDTTTYNIAQEDHQFKPFVSVVPINAEVVFPNNDTVAHHVYSFSSAKNFEIKLYKGDLPNPVTMDKTGVVVLGCNIHDWMVAYIYVVDSTIYGVTDQSGEVNLTIPDGSIENIYVWHPGLKGNDEFQQRWDSSHKMKQVSISIKPTYFWKPQVPESHSNY